MERRIVITGLWVVSTIGIGVSQFVEAALEGRSGITALRPWAGFPLDAYRCQIGGQVRDFQVAQFLEAGVAERVDRYAQFAMVASTEALRHASSSMEHEEAHRVGVIVGAGTGGMMMGEREITKLNLSQLPESGHPNYQ